MDILERYFKKIGGRPTGDGPPKEQKKRGRKSASAAGTPNPPNKKVKTEVPVRRGRGRSSMKAEDAEDEKVVWPTVNDSWKPPKVEKDSWEDILLSVEAIHQEEDPKTKESPLWA